MIAEDIYNLLNDIPSHVDYTDLVEELDLEDVPKERINALINILDSEKDIYILFRVSFILTSWGIDKGFQKITQLLYNGNLDYLILNNLKLKDDTYKHVLSSYISYWAVNSDNGKSEEARKEIYQPIKFIIDLANINHFQISCLFWLVKDKSFNEYIPLLQQHLKNLLNKYRNMYWEIHELSKLFLDIGYHDFIEQIFCDNDIKLSDYGL